MATASRDSSDTERITFSVCLPIQSISPSSDSASIRINRAAKKSNVDHSTREITDSMSSLFVKSCKKILKCKSIVLVRLRPQENLPICQNEQQKCTEQCGPAQGQLLNVRCRVEEEESDDKRKRNGRLHQQCLASNGVLEGKNSLAYIPINSKSQRRTFRFISSSVAL